MDEITQNPKCRLHLCLIVFIDWRYSQSCWNFRPLYWFLIEFTDWRYSQSCWNLSTPLTFSLVHRVGPALHDNASSLCANLWLAILARGHLARTHSHKVIPPQRRLRMCKAAAPSTCRIRPSYKHFPPIPCFVERVHTKPPVLRERLFLFCTHKHLLSWAGAHNLFYNYGRRGDSRLLGKGPHRFIHTTQQRRNPSRDTLPLNEMRMDKL